MLLLLTSLLLAATVKLDYPGLNQEALVKCLWAHQKPAVFFENSDVKPPPFDAECIRMHNGYVDYACGRCVKLYIDQDSVTRYDHSCTPEVTLKECVAQLQLEERIGSGKERADKYHASEERGSAEL